MGVISADLGSSGVAEVTGCTPTGDDGLLRSGACAGDNAAYVWSYPDYQDINGVIADVSCRADLGAAGCPYAQPLEAALKALWPAVDIDPKTNQRLKQNRIQFLGESQGHGDRENAGFERNDPVKGLSELAIVLITDKDDCSAANPALFAATDGALDGLSAQQAAELRCALNPNLLQPLKRYVNGLKALRPGNESLVLLSVIAGVPPDLVDSQVFRNVDFSVTAVREAFYQRILDDPRMQTAGSSQDTALPRSCTGKSGSASAPRRLVEAARGFAENGWVSSICSDDWADAMVPLFDGAPSPQHGFQCVPASHPRYPIPDADGLVRCRVLWDLPPYNPERPTTPSRCADRPWLHKPKDGTALTASGHARCEVDQVPVVSSSGELSPVPDRFGWYFDDFSQQTRQRCGGGPASAIVLTDNMQLLSGITVHLECIDDLPHLEIERADLAPGVVQPAIGSPCDPLRPTAAGLAGDDACRITLADAAGNQTFDTTLFCHPRRNVCVLGCASDKDCQGGFICDANQSKLARDAGRAICVNPSCNVQ